MSGVHLTHKSLRIRSRVSAFVLMRRPSGIGFEIISMLTDLLLSWQNEHFHRRRIREVFDFLHFVEHCWTDTTMVKEEIILYISAGSPHLNRLPFVWESPQTDQPSRPFLPCGFDNGHMTSVLSSTLQHAALIPVCSKCLVTATTRLALRYKLHWGPVKDAETSHVNTFASWDDQIYI